jgi:hypothetical protein
MTNAEITTSLCAKARGGPGNRLRRFSTASVGAPGRHWSSFLVILFIAGWVAVNLLWLSQNRAGQPHNIDEDGYFSMALNDYFGGARGGPLAWVQTVLAPGVQAPLTSAMSSFGFLFAGPRFGAAIAFITLSAAIALGLTAALAARFNSRPIIWISLVLVATTPGFIQMSRIFVFAIPATAVTMGAIYALTRSNQLASLRWSVGLGVLIGLMPLARTMTVAFVPGFALVIILQLIATRQDRIRRLVHAAVAAAVAVVVAGVWLIPSGSLVFDYLTNYGYGAHSAEYARDTTSLLASVVRTLTSMLFFPHFVILLFGWVLVVVVGIQTAAARGLSTTLRSAVGSPVFACGMVVIVGCVALASSPNAGLGFSLPLIPPALIVAAWGIWKTALLLRKQWQRSVALAAILVAALVLSTESTFENSPLALPRSIDLPGVNGVVVTQGRDLDPAYLNTTAGIVNDRASGSGWSSANETVTKVIASSPGRPDAAFGFRHHYFNVNSVQVAVLERLHYGIGEAQIDPTTTPATVRGYVDWLTKGAASASCWLLTSPGTTNEFAPAVNTSELEKAARASGFIPKSEVNLPDGRIVTMWRSSASSCASP